MTNACILVRLTVGKHTATREAVKKFKEVKEAFFVFGRYDMAVLARAQDRNTLIKLAAKVNALPGVRATETLIEA
jgi:uncharacterized protein with GYD domain